MKLNLKEFYRKPGFYIRAFLLFLFIGLPYFGIELIPEEYKKLIIGWIISL